MEPTFIIVGKYNSSNKTFTVSLDNLQDLLNLDKDEILRRINEYQIIRTELIDAGHIRKRNTVPPLLMSAWRDVEVNNDDTILIHLPKVSTNTNSALFASLFKEIMEEKQSWYFMHEINNETLMIGDDVTIIPWDIIRMLQEQIDMDNYENWILAYTLASAIIYVPNWHIVDYTTLPLEEWPEAINDSLKMPNDKYYIDPKKINVVKEFVDYFTNFIKPERGYLSL